MTVIEVRPNVLRELECLITAGMIAAVRTSLRIRRMKSYMTAKPLASREISLTNITAMSETKQVIDGTVFLSSVSQTCWD